MRIAVVGSGYVGLVAAVCLAEIGHEVTCVDNDENKVAILKNGGVPIHEHHLPELLARHSNRTVTFSSSLAEAVQKSEVLFIAVGTPQSESGEADLSYVEAVARELAQHVNGFKLIVEKSTVPVLTSTWIRRVMLLNGAPENAFDVASNPEFLREGTAVVDFLYPDRIVIGVDSPRSADLLTEVYDPLVSGKYYEGAMQVPPPAAASIPPRLIRTSTKSAEIIKHASNAFLAMKISFINAVSNVCEAVGADIEQVCQGVGSDSRIGPRFLRPGVGYGGSCFPKDLAAFSVVARECGYDFPLLQEVMRVNQQQRVRFLRKVRSALWTIRGKKLGVLGLAFKGGTDDIRESPAIAVVQDLLREGSEIRAFDPAAMDRAKEVLMSETFSLVDSPYLAAEGADALLILTDWEDFAELDLERLRSVLTYPIVIDGRNLFDPSVMASHGFRYYSVGRPEAHPSKQESLTEVPLAP